MFHTSSVRRRVSIVVGLALCTAVLFAGTLVGPTKLIPFMAVLNGGQENPAVDEGGFGVAYCTLDTKNLTLTYSVSYQGLTGVATAAHFHGPATPGANAGVRLDIGGSSPINGCETVSKTFMKDLKKGLLYINVHTAANPGGEIRGQVMPMKPTYKIKATN